ncbi:hypothetical protein SAMN05428975_3785 [Mucilaginibacter sp. OK268]|uniref:hypothetical protein n=1 Tax=Mucilaginibacter sp. OK268 TaxID=1881048 RepID=UPI000885DFF2|nr:hypothetical protein [Mucilaginibacter sp. OK268]SDP93733.1 hypothetical protein SAMN05428975_3785 [Mucilaginibacter sp. OK268]
MLTADTYLYKSNKPSFLILFNIWVYNHLKSYSNKLEASLVKDFERDYRALENDFLQLSKLTPKEALKELKYFKIFVNFINKVDKSLYEVDSHKIKAAFRQLKKITYKTEARLHRIAYMDNEVIETSETLKNQISNLGTKSILSHL